MQDMVNDKQYLLSQKCQIFSSLYNTLSGKIGFNSEWDHTAFFSSQHNTLNPNT